MLVGAKKLGEKKQRSRRGKGMEWCRTQLNSDSMSGRYDKLAINAVADDKLALDDALSGVEWRFENAVLLGYETTSTVQWTLFC